MRKIKWFAFLLVFTFVIMVLDLPGDETKAKGSTSSPIEILTKYLYEGQYSDFPPEVIKRAKYLILDSIGCALGGTQTELGRRYLRMAKSWGGGSEATIIGYGINVSAMNAAFINTQLANLLDFDDTYDFYLPGHPGCEIIQTALAVGEKVNATGKELLTAIILAYEVSLRVGRAGRPILWGIPVSTSSVFLGPTSVSCRLLKLNCEEINIAFRHTQFWTLPFQRQKHDYPEGVLMPEIKGNLGTTSIIGILAALEAQQSLTAKKGVLDGDLETWYLAGGVPGNYDIITKGLGSHYRLMDVSFKPTPSCRFTHASITAAWEALDYKPVKNEDISQIIIKGVERLNRLEFGTMIQAQFSLPCALALAVTGVEPGPKWYITGRFKEPDIRELAGKVKFQYVPEAKELEIKQGKIMSTVKIIFKDGTVKEATSKHIKGAPDNPMSEQELRAKFKANAGGIISESRINNIIHTVMDLEKLARVSDLTKILISKKLVTRE